jgi:molybdopterin-biosynthesis enzyme MoeA-like protein
LRIGLYVVGDEILSGRRADRHLTQVISILSRRGLALSWASFLPDDRDALVESFRRSFATQDLVFSCGGIGATPDDHTRQAAALAAGVELALDAQAREWISAAVAKRGLTDLDTPEGRRILAMGEFPSGAGVIPNGYNGIPGFSWDRHYFVPGFPVMAWPMIEWVLDTHYRAAFGERPIEERSVLLYEVRESTITPVMLQLEQEFAGIRTFSLPSVGDGVDGRPTRRHVELGVKGDPALVEAAYARMRELLAGIGLAGEPAPPRHPPA